MKGQRIYNSAALIRGKIYKYPSDFNEIEMKELYQEYLALIRRSAYLGYIEAQYEYAQQYEDMSFLGVKNPMYNPRKCIYWYSKACNKGHAEACNNLAHIYELDEKFEGNFDLALKLYKKSGELGSRIGGKNYKLMLRDLAKGGKYEK